MRRHVSQGLSFLIVVAVIAAIACGEASTATSPASTAPSSAPTAAPGETPELVPTTAPTATPIPESGEPAAQRLRVISRSERESNDPAQVISHHMHQFDNVLETLFYDDQFAKFVPHLVSEWNVSADGKTWNLKLRKASHSTMTGESSPPRMLCIP